MSNPFVVIIPSRYGSTRLPGKALADIAGKPMIERVIEQCIKSDARQIVVATDDERIATAATRAGAVAVMTSDQPRSGSDRVAEAAKMMGLAGNEVIVNVQGDEPGVPPSLINQVARILDESGAHAMSTAVTPISSESEMHDPSVVKAILDAKGHALYFSRSPVPYAQNRPDRSLAVAKRHIGIYGYRASFIQEYANLSPCLLEEQENLEQLRVLWHGGRIKCVEVEALPASGIDTEQDLQFIRSLYEGA